MSWEFWIDRGGTFTDIVAKAPDGTLQNHKLLSENPEQYKDAAVQGILDVLESTGSADQKISTVKMGTTVATNALLERKGAEVHLVITKGFRDLLKIGYQSRPDLFAMHIVRPETLYQSVQEVDARMDASGAELVPLDLQKIRNELASVFETGVRSIAIALMHAYVNSDHERQIAQIAREIGFEQISTSHEVSGLAKLVGRGDTCVVDAYLSPILRRYVAQVADALTARGGCDALMFMQSNGGLTDANRFQGKDAILSGPAGGIVGMVRTGQAAGQTHLIGFDMGGTSTDVSHFAGRFERSFETEVAGVRVRAPMMDIHTVAAGGGSICSFKDGRFQVGPESAGADPGPACYRRGGPITVTDCNVMLGSLLPEHFPNVFGPHADEPLDPRAVRRGFETLLVDDGHKSIEDMAEGFLKIAVENMANAIKKISVEQGHDITKYTLQCFGGAGGQHACMVARSLGIKRVMVHPFAGVLSAYGMGLADISDQREGQLDCSISDTQAQNRLLAKLRDKAVETVRAQGVEDVQVNVTAHLRYEGQHQSLEVAFASPQDMAVAFEQAHTQRFGFSSPERALQVELLGVEALGKSNVDVGSITTHGNGEAIGQTKLYRGGWLTADVYHRDNLCAGQTIKGPAILLEPTGTNVVEPGWNVRTDDLGNLIFDDTGAAASQTAGTDVDPVLLEVTSNRFMSIADQMGATLANTSWSVNIKERLDFSCAIFDAKGDLVANAPHVPVHLGSMSDSIKTVMHQNDDIRDGDAFMLNSPYNGGTHLPDVTLVTPVFYDGVVLCWLGSRGHHADIGGRTPGSAPPDSTHIDEEGVLIDNVRIVRDGRLDEELTEGILASGKYPCRNIPQNTADLKAQIAANETGRTGLLKMVADYGAAGVSAYMGHVQDNAEASVRSVLSTLAGGRFKYPMDTGQVIEVDVRVNQKDQTAEIDFTGTSPQHAGNYNAPSAVCRAVVLYVFRLMVGKNIPLNEGCLKPLNIIVPDGSMLNPKYPAAVIAGNTEVSQATCNALIGALGLMAGSQATMNNFVWGNEEFQNYETIAGGTGAGPGFNGCDAVQTHMTNTLMTDPEILEKRFPVILEEFGIHNGSGGAGQFTGGCGSRRRLKFLTPVTVTTLCSHREIEPFGAQGGAPGQVGENWAEMPDGTRVDLKGNDEIDLPAGAVFGMHTPGGGGWGQP